MEESYFLQDYSDNQPVYSVDPVCGMKIEEGRTETLGPRPLIDCTNCGSPHDLRLSVASIFLGISAG
jgi:hypothetical protein